MKPLETDPWARLRARADVPRGDRLAAAQMTHHGAVSTFRAFAEELIPCAKFPSTCATNGSAFATGYGDAPNNV